MESLEKEFDRRFGKNGIKLPGDKIERREGGVLGNDRNTVFYAFGKDEKGEHVNIYTEHKFAWGHYHLRIYESGEVMKLPIVRDILFTSLKDTEEEVKRKEAERQKHNRMVCELLEKEGITAVMDKEAGKFAECLKDRLEKYF